MQVRIKFKGILDEAKKQRGEIEKIRQKYQTAAEQVQELYAAGKITEGWRNSQLAQLRQEQETKIAEAIESVRAVGRKEMETGRKENRPNAKMIDDDIVKILNSGISLSLSEWEDLVHENRYNPTMLRLLKSVYDKNPIMITENRTGLIDGEVSYPAEIKWPQLPSERSEIFAKFCDFLGDRLEGGGYFPEKEYRDIDSYWADRARDYIAQIDKEYEPISPEALERDFPVARPEVKEPIIW